MKKKIVSFIIATLTTLTLTACTEEEIANYVVVGGISEPTRVWNEAPDGTEVAEVETPVEEEITEEAYSPTVYDMEPQIFVATKTAELLTSDKDWEVTDTVDEGTELTLVGYTAKGYYITEGGDFISASDVVAKAEEAEAEQEQVAETPKTETTTTAQPTTTTTTTQNNTTPTTTTTEQTQPTEQPQQEQPSQEPQQTYEEPQQQTQTAEAEQPTQSENFYDADDFDYEAWYAQAEAERLAEQERQATCQHANTEFIAEWAHDLATGEWVSATHCLDCGAYF